MAPVEAPKPRLTVLVVDDEPINRMMIARILGDRCAVVEADGGAAAIARVEAGGIDVVLLDIYMPGMDGYETTRRLKAMTGARLLPVILMTANNDEASFTAGLDNGADDFLLKPVRRTLLEGKMIALLRLAEAQRQLEEKNEELNAWRAQAEEDFAAARKVFAHVTGRGRFDLPGVSVRGEALGAFNGDIVLTGVLADGGLRIMVGDFAGHGLGAAIAALPVSDAFHGMLKIQRPIEDVARAIGGRLHVLLPRNLFLAACIVDVDPVRGRVKVWNGGLPSAMALDSRGGVVGRAVSQHCALGILPEHEVGKSTVELPLPLDGRLIVYTDGLTEAESSQGEVFGEPRLEAVLGAVRDRADWCDRLWETFGAFRSGARRGDDVTFIGVANTEALRAALGRISSQGPRSRPSGSMLATSDEAK